MVKLSPDLLPRPRLRHWLKARGNPRVAWGLAELEARDRRRWSLQLSGQGVASPDSQEDRGGSRRVAPQLRVVRGGKVDREGGRTT